MWSGFCVWFCFFFYNFILLLLAISLCFHGFYIDSFSDHQNNRQKRMYPCSQLSDRADQDNVCQSSSCWIRENMLQKLEKIKSKKNNCMSSSFLIAVILHIFLFLLDFFFFWIMEDLWCVWLSLVNPRTEITFPNILSSFFFFEIFFLYFK